MPNASTAMAELPASEYVLLFYCFQREVRIGKGDLRTRAICAANGLRLTYFAYMTCATSSPVSQRCRRP